jgi:Zn-dependent oligopeptidase
MDNKMDNKMNNKMNLEKILVRFDYSIDDIDNMLIEIQNIIRDFKNKIIKGEDKISIINNFDGTLSNIFLPINFLQNVHTDSNIRNKSIEFSEKVQKLLLNLYSNKKIYNILNKYYEKNRNNLNEIENRFIEFVLDDFKDSGIDLSIENQKIYKRKLLEIINLENKYSKNLNDFYLKKLFTKNQLTGLNKKFMEKHKKGDKYEIEFSYPDYFEIMKNCSNEKTRKDVERIFLSRCNVKNEKYLIKILQLRKEIAKLMGFNNYFDFVLRKNRMAKNNNEIQEFIQNIHKINKEKLLKEFTIINKQFPNNLQTYDVSYYITQRKKNEFEVDENKISEYFEKNNTINEIFKFYEKLFSIKVSKIDNFINILKWNNDISLYQVSDFNDKLIGYFYLDMHPREGKYGHAAAFELQKSFTYKSYIDNNIIPVSAMVCNFNNNNPSLLKHSEVETFLHEMGHIFHMILTKVEYARLSGANTEWDFVEAPSQALENWAWNKDFLKKISKHYKNGKKIPDNLIKNLVDSRYFLNSFNLGRQMALSNFDWIVHTTDNITNLKNIWDNNYKEFSLLTPQNNVYPYTNWGHIVGGYSAGYYGYLWSNIYALNIYKKFMDSDILINTDLGDKLKYDILEKGNTYSAKKLVKDFLGNNINYNIIKNII